MAECARRLPAARTVPGLVLLLVGLVHGIDTTRTLLAGLVVGTAARPTFEPVAVRSVRLALAIPFSGSRRGR